MKNFLKSYSYFSLIGVSGAGINLLLTALFTETLFGAEQYFLGYLIGLSVNILYNFTLHTIITFKTQQNHARRLAYFTAYYLGLAAVQGVLVHQLTRILGVQHYLLSILLVMFVLSTISYLFFRNVLFSE